MDGYSGSPASHSRRTSITIAAPNSTHSPDEEKSSPTKPKRSVDGDEHSVEEDVKKIELEDEKDGAVDTGPFPKEFTPLRLARLVDPKSLQSLTELGGIDGVLTALDSDTKRGLPGSASKDREGSTASISIEERQRIYGHNILPTRKSKSLLLLMWIALKDKVLVLLSIAAVVSLALGLFQDFGTPRETYSCGNGQTCTLPPVDWVEGVAIMVAIIIVVLVGSLNDWQKEKQFKVLNEKKEDRTVRVMRDGIEMVINTKVRLTIV